MDHTLNSKDIKLIILRERERGFVCVCVYLYTCECIHVCVPFSPMYRAGTRLDSLPSILHRWVHPCPGLKTTFTGRRLQLSLVRL